MAPQDPELAREETLRRVEEHLTRAVEAAKSGGVTLEELLAMGKRWGLIYAAGLAVYLFITWRVYGLRYDYASRAQTMYASRLKHLLNRYGREKPEKTKENRGGRGR